MLDLQKRLSRHILRGRIHWLAIVFLLSYILFSWCFRLNVSPGLHGDEAWAGIKAIDGFSGLLGMNDYTGVIEPAMARVSFGIFCKGVWQLRLPGVVLNLAGLLLIVFTILKTGNLRAVIIFLGLFLQSALLITSARVAWEVNSLTLLLIAFIFLWWTKNTRQRTSQNPYADYLFLLVNIIGTYNHVIFSSVAFAIGFAVLIWMIKWKTNQLSDILPILICNLFNVSVIFLLMRYYLPDQQNQVLPVMIALIMPLLQVIVLRGSNIARLPQLANHNRIRILALSIAVTGGITFLFYHGIAFMQLLQNEKVFLQLFSFESSIAFTVLLWIGAVLFTFYLVKFAAEDWKDKTASLHVLCILCYMGVITCYTQKTSFRYYLILYLLVCLYMAFAIAARVRRKQVRLLGGLILLSAILVQGIVLEVLLDPHIPVKAYNFTIGNGQKETSAHFLPKQPLVQFLRDNRIGNIAIQDDDPYFISQPVLFYEKVQPWKKDKTRTGFISYNFEWYGSGFIYYKTD